MCMFVCVYMCLCGVLVVCVVSGVFVCSVPVCVVLVCFFLI